MSSVRMQSIHFLLFIGTLIAASLLNADFAYAQQGTLGGMLEGMTDGLVSVPVLLSSVSILLGLGFITYGIMGFIRHVDNPSREPINTPIRFLFAGAFFLTLPVVAGIAVRTFGLQTGDLNLGLDVSASGEAGTIDGMLTSLTSNIYGPFITLMSVFCYIAGIFVLMGAVYRITKGMDQGPRGPLGLGTAMSFMLAAVLLSGPQALGAITTTLFGTADVVTNPVFADSAGFDADLKARAEQIMNAVQTFLVIIGIISFFRGWFILRSVADGNGQATALSAFSHIIAGVVAVNIGPFVNAVQKTFGLDPANGLLFQ